MEDHERSAVTAFATPRPGRVSWVVSMLLHAGVIAAAVLVSWRTVVVPHVTFFTIGQPDAVTLPPLAAAGGGTPPHVTAAPRPVARPVVAPAPARAPAPAAAPAPTTAPTGVTPAPIPQLGDGRLWAAPRPALPNEVAGALYGGVKGPSADSVVVQRLQAMIDSV